MTDNRIVLATGNAGKLAEIRDILRPVGIQVVAQADFGVTAADETGLSFVENALIKARHAARETGLPAIADDSGICVDALRGAPGIYSSRYAGPDADDTKNRIELLRALGETPEDARGACFFCAMVLIKHPEDPIPMIASAKWCGVITRTETGHNGFGYDPIFRPENMDCTSAELSPEMKNGISHRGKALQELITLIRQG